MTSPADLIRRNVWSVESVYENASVPTMLSSTELKMLEWLGRTFPLSENGLIVDAGSFLGGSTAALAAGLACNTHQATTRGRIHSYDMFLAPNDHYSQGLIGHRPPGSSVFDIFERSLGGHRDLVTAHKGDFNDAEMPSDPVDILFVDIAKSWQLNGVVAAKFFPKLVPGHSIVVQQDHNDHSCPWVNVTMEYFRDYFDYLTDDSASRLFLYRKVIPTNELAVDLSSLPTDEKVRLAIAAAKRSGHPASEYVSMVSVAWLIAERSPVEAAKYLDDLPPQPWTSETPYIEQVKGAIAYQARIGHDNYIRDYFASN